MLKCARAVTLSIPASKKSSTLLDRSISFAGVIVESNPALTPYTLLKWCPLAPFLFMRKFKLSLLRPGILALVCFYSTFASYAADCSLDKASKKVSVSYIHDGDTFFTGGKEKIRVIGLDTPELARNNRAAEQYSKQARDLFLQLVKSSANTLQLRFDVKKKDRYQRSLAHVFLESGENLAVSLLENGFATALIIPPNLSFADCYLKAQRYARANKRGIWRLPEYQLLGLAEIDPAQSPQYRLLSGVVKTVESEHFKQKLVLEDGDRELIVYIKSSEKFLFNHWLNKKLVGKKVVVQGWINRDNDQLYIYIRHPGFISLLSEFL